MKDIDRLLVETVRTEGSDLHLLSNAPPRIRRFGKLGPLSSAPIERDVLAGYLDDVMTEHARTQFEEQDGADFSYSLPNVARFRVNAFRFINGIGAVFRAIPSEAATLEELELPPVISDLTRLKQGLVLVTGKTGSGKTTTLAAIIDAINLNRHGHIITIEDPIEYVHNNKRCLISQREVGSHTPNFAAALRSALREDPDVIMVGELRDLETIRLAVTAAETGILVLGTLHTNRAATTIDRIINVFPARKQAHVRTMLSTSLRAIITQQLVEKLNEPGQIAATEILINTPAVGNLIREGKTDQLESAMQTGTHTGMHTMDNSLSNMVATTQISKDEAFEKAFQKEQFNHPG